MKKKIKKVKKIYQEITNIFMDNIMIHGGGGIVIEVENWRVKPNLLSYFV